MADMVSNYWYFSGSKDTPWEAIVAYWSELGPDYEFQVNAERTEAWAYLSTKWNALDYGEGEMLKDLFPELEEADEGSHAGIPDRAQLTSIWLRDTEEREAAVAELDRRQGGVRARREQERKEYEERKAREKAEEEERIKNDPDHPLHESFPYQCRYQVEIDFTRAEEVLTALLELVNDLPDAVVADLHAMTQATLVITLPYGAREQLVEAGNARFAPAEGEPLYARVTLAKHAPDMERRAQIKADEEESAAP